MRKLISMYGASDKISHTETKLKKKFRSKKRKDSDDDDFGGKCLEDYGVFLLNGEIDEFIIDEGIRFILEANFNSNCRWEYMTIIVNSPGGYVTDGFALIDIMNGSKIPVRTLGIGLLASMGLQIFLSGNKGTRTLTPNTMILSHQYSGVAYGKEHELFAARTEHDQTTEIILRHYRETTGLSDEDIRKYLLPANDVWIEAKAAKKLGICDIVKDVKPSQLKQKTEK